MTECFYLPCPVRNTAKPKATRHEKHNYNHGNSINSIPLSCNLITNLWPEFNTVLHTVKMDIFLFGRETDLYINSLCVYIVLIVLNKVKPKICKCVWYDRTVTVFIICQIYSLNCYQKATRKKQTIQAICVCWSPILNKIFDILSYAWWIKYVKYV